MKLINAGLVMLVATLAGCASVYPVPVKEPGLTSNNVPLPAPANLSIELNPTNFDAALASIASWARWYTHQADNLRLREYRSGDVALLGGLIGVAGGLAESAALGLSGAVIAGGASIVSKRYVFVVQARNYEKASGAMHCLGDALADDSQKLTTPNLITARINQVRRKLRELQGSVQLAEVDLDAFETALREADEAEQEQQTAEANAQQALVQAQNLAPNAANYALQVNQNKLALSFWQATATQAKQDQVKAELDKCVSAFK